MPTLDTEDLKKTITEIHVNNDVTDPQVHESVFQHIKNYVLSIIQPLEKRVEELEADIEEEFSEGDDTVASATVGNEPAVTNQIENLPGTVAAIGSLTSSFEISAPSPSANRDGKTQGNLSEAGGEATPTAAGSDAGNATGASDTADGADVGAEPTVAEKE